MRKRTKLRKKGHTNPYISSKIMSIEQSICESHSKEKLYETIARTGQFHIREIKIENYEVEYIYSRV